jgi:CBS domain-containing protein
MIAQQLISNDIFPLKKTDNCETALMLMQDWKIAELPVVDNGQILGYVTIHQLADASPQTKVQTLVGAAQAYKIVEQTHLFELIRLFAETGLSMMCVTDSTGNKLTGIVSYYDLIRSYRQTALAQPGAIIMLQMPSRSYTLTEISRLVEMNDAKILHVYIHKTAPDDDHIDVSIKINTTQVKNILTTFDRYQYQITGVFQAEQTDEEVDNRFKILMHYLKL